MNETNIIALVTKLDWKFLISVIGVCLTISGLFFSLWKFLDSRKRELEWKKTEFVFFQASKMDENSKVSRVVRIIDGHDELKPEDIVTHKGAFCSSDPDIIDGVHNLLNTLDRLAYAYQRHSSISLEELEPFFWYFTSIQRNTHFSTFCRKNGYRKVLDTSESIQEFLDQ